MSTFDSWNQLIKMSTKSIDIGSFYWTLRGADFYNHSTAWQGEHIFNNILHAGTKRGIKIRIAQSKPSSVSPNIDTEILVKRKAAEVRSVDFDRLFGSGVLHTKFWIVDDEHFYIGSANMDWRSLTQVIKKFTYITSTEIVDLDDLVNLLMGIFRLKNSVHWSRIAHAWQLTWRKCSTFIGIWAYQMQWFHQLGLKSIILASMTPIHCLCYSTGIIRWTPLSRYVWKSGFAKSSRAFANENLILHLIQ